MTFSKATKTASKLRLAMYGPSGSGKTYTALQIASGIGGRIAVIDTEFGSASKYADRFQFDTAEAHNPDINNLVDMIHQANGYSVLVIDSLSHSWQELLQEVDQLAKAKYRGNSWSAWSDGTPKQKELVKALLSYPGHLIATMRAKTEWTTADGKNGTKQPQRVGLAPEQGKGIEYEFDMLMEISAEHMVRVIKDRTGKFQDTVLDRPGPELGKEIVSWLQEGAAPETVDRTAFEVRRRQEELRLWIQDQPFNKDQKKYLLDVAAMQGRDEREWLSILDEVAKRRKLAEEFLRKEPKSA